MYWFECSSAIFAFFCQRGALFDKEQILHACDFVLLGKRGEQERRHSTFGMLWVQTHHRWRSLHSPLGIIDNFVCIRCRLFLCVFFNSGANQKLSSSGAGMALNKRGMTVLLTAEEVSYTALICCCYRDLYTRCL